MKVTGAFDGERLTNNGANIRASTANFEVEARRIDRTDKISGSV